LIFRRVSATEPIDRKSQAGGAEFVFGSRDPVFAFAALYLFGITFRSASRSISRRLPVVSLAILEAETGICRGARRNISFVEPVRFLRFCSELAFVGRLRQGHIRSRRR